MAQRTNISLVSQYVVMIVVSSFLLGDMEMYVFMHF